MATEIDTKNDCLVGMRGDRVKVLIPRSDLSKDGALRMAAYLVLMANGEEEFPAVLEAVMNT